MFYFILGCVSGTLLVHVAWHWMESRKEARADEATRLLEKALNK